MSDEITVRESGLDIEGLNTLEIAHLIDAINVYSSQLWNIKLFKIEGIPLATVTLGCENDSMAFDVFCASLGALIDCLDGKSIKSKIPGDDIKKKYTDLNCRIIDDEYLVNHLKEIFSIDDDIIFHKIIPAATNHNRAAGFIENVSKNFCTAGPIIEVNSHYISKTTLPLNTM